MRCLTGFAIYMWLLVVSRSSDYWLGISQLVIPIALVDVEVCLGIPSCGNHWVPRGSRGLILGSTGRGAPFWGALEGGAPFCIPPVFSQHMSSPVSSFSTALIISTEKRRLARVLGDCLSWLTFAQDNIASCATERKLGFLLRVIWAGPLDRESVAFVAKRGDLLGGSILGAAGMGWSILFSLINLGYRLVGSTLGAMMLVAPPLEKYRQRRWFSWRLVKCSCGWARANLYVAVFVDFS